uniref:arsenate reductase (glutaredoxin) n=1 Tax=Halomonas sp. TaxID=1486246 RepID=UPI002632E15B|nr:arsenate reductase (glutaredoxin) [Halomonas sp.]
MPPITLLHNPRCSKSREALALLEEAGVDVSVRRYLDEPLSAAELHDLVSRLQGDTKELVRTNESEWKALAADSNDIEQVIAAIVAHPKVLQRPIADDGKRVIIGRPPENIRELLA